MQPSQWYDKVREHLEIPSWLSSAISRVQTLALANLAQPAIMPHFHLVGFEKVSIPREMYARILTARKKALRDHG